MDAVRTRRISGAYHEAGHALIGVRHGASLLYVQLDKGGNGQTAFSRSTVTAIAEVRVAMAGPAAEYIHLHGGEKKFSLDDCNASMTDLDDILGVCSQISPERPEDTRDEHWVATCKILLIEWSTVQSIAKALLESSEPYLNSTTISALTKSARQ
jgi:hypothetical protein